jgi:hypothetical protein
VADSGGRHSHWSASGGCQRAAFWSGAKGPIFCISIYHAHVTQPLLLEQLREWSVDISSRQIESLLAKGKEGFHEKKATILKAGLEVSDYITEEKKAEFDRRFEEIFTTQTRFETLN